MDWIFVILIGLIVGYLGSLLTHSRQGLIGDIVVGIVGALLARYLFGTVLGIGGAGAAGSLTLGGILWAVLGAAILITILRAFHLYGGGSNNS